MANSIDSTTLVSNIDIPVNMAALQKIKQCAGPKSMIECEMWTDKNNLFNFSLKLNFNEIMFTEMGF